MDDTAPAVPSGHHWVVFGRTLEEGWLMLQCTKCGLHGTVDDPTQEEWSRAFDAPPNPYPWADEARITRHPEVRTAPDYWARFRRPGPEEN
jgi:hypothetical protein